MTPQDASVNGDDHFGSDARTARFLGVVVPTLIDQLEASLVMVAVPWGLEAAAPRLVLVGALPGAEPVIEARRLHRIDGAQVGPWWTLGREAVAPPDELAALAPGLRL